MPELPEVETTRLGIQDHILGQRVARVIVRETRLRWPVPSALARELPGRTFARIARRGKYLLLFADDDCLVIHLGMSGSLRIVGPEAPPLKHDHVDICLDNGMRLRYCDPRRFGCLLWLKEPPEQHSLLNHLGPEPLTDAFSKEYLFTASRGRRSPVKTFIMDSDIVVGVGNIYANEALFMAGIRPDRAAGSISKQRYGRLVECIKTVLGEAIAQGGTTLRDFVGGDGKPGYFKQSLLVYGRAGQACQSCGRPLLEIRMAQRSSVYCKHCQR
ncbi:MAG: bifunctional DNA-formamidopyrimidine glycosylase/DNA-(apurinic or apyrimidinic site) lyase [Gammaproteobacteria bacterium]